MNEEIVKYTTGNYIKMMTNIKRSPLFEITGKDKFARLHISYNLQEGYGNIRKGFREMGVKTA